MVQTVQSADRGPLNCPNGTTVFLEGFAAPGASLISYFAGTPVGGGSANARGQYRIPLRAQERPGIYEVEVRLRGSRTLVDRFQCYVNVPLTEAPTATPEIIVTTEPPTPTTTPTSSAVGGAAPTGTTTARPNTSPTAGGSPTITPSTRPTNVIVDGAVEIIEVAYADSNRPDEEYVQIVNGGDNDLDIAGWRLINATRSDRPAYTFPRYNFLSGNVLIVWTGEGQDDLSIGDFYWNRNQSVWSEGDVAELRDPANRLIDTFTVGD